MPDHYSRPEFWVELSGVAELLGGAGLLVPAARRISSTGLAAMLVVFDVHLYMLRYPERFAQIPKSALWARLPMQAVLIWWVLQAGKTGEETQ